MLDTNLIETPQDVKHSLDEIRGANSTRKTLRVRMRELWQVNRALTDTITADDPEWQAICRNRYLLLLSVVHINGAGGALVS